MSGSSVREPLVNPVTALNDSLNLIQTDESVI